MPPAIPPPAWLLPALLLAAYGLGGLSPGWWLVRRAKGADLRTQGSGATGATNAGRVLGTRGFILVLVLDAIKGAVAVIGVRLLAPGSPWTALALPAVVAGHIWPIWLGFRGGRGGAPLLGGSLACNGPLTLVAIAVGVGIGLLGRNRFLAGAVAFVLSMLLMGWRLPTAPERISYLFAGALVLLAHRSYFTKYFAP